MVEPADRGDETTGAAAVDADLANLSEEDRAFVREARRLLAERQKQPPIAEGLLRRMQSEVGEASEDPQPTDD